MAKEKKCPECGKVFESRVGQQKFCSVECRESYYKKNKPPKLYYHCEHCGKVYKEGSTNPFCSDECKNTYSSGRAKKRGRKKKPLSIAKINRLAKQEGLTYGQYIVKYGG